METQSQSQPSLAYQPNGRPVVNKENIELALGPKLLEDLEVTYYERNDAFQVNPRKHLLKPSGAEAERKKWRALNRADHELGKAGFYVEPQSSYPSKVGNDTVFRPWMCVWVNKTPRVTQGQVAQEVAKTAESTKSLETKVDTIANSVSQLAQVVMAMAKGKLSPEQVEQMKAAADEDHLIGPENPVENAEGQSGPNEDDEGF